MIHLKYNFIIVVILLSCFMCSSKFFINGVSHTCLNEAGRLGRCTSRDSCSSQMHSNRIASIYQCPNGLGKRPFVCCIFGSSIVFPDDEEPERSIGYLSVNTKSKVTESSVSAVWFPDKIRYIPNPSRKATERTESEDKKSLSGDESMNKSPEVTETSVSEVWFPDKIRHSPTPSRNATPRAARFGESRPQAIANVSNLFPQPPNCGPTTVGEKIYNGVEAQLGEFPWLVNLEYRNAEQQLQIECAGSIINHRFVLTAAHCVQGEIQLKIGNVVSFRAGDHNTKMDPDCDKRGCMPPFKRYEIEKRIVHEKYSNDSNGRAFYDIALLKSKERIVYNLVSIAPICLPDTIYPMPTLRHNFPLTVAGWGSDVNVRYTKEKRIVTIPYVPNEICPLRVVKTEQICAGGLNEKDSCSGDSGGSLCRLTSDGWQIEGIVSYGRLVCGTRKPGVYTRVRSYLDWIHAYVDEN